MSTSDLGAMIKAARVSLGLTQEDLGRAVGVSNGFLSNLENGRARAPGDAKLEQIARLLGLSPAEVFAAAGRVHPEVIKAYQRDPGGVLGAVREMAEKGT